MARSRALRRLPASAGSAGSYNPKRAVWFSAALLAVLAPPVWAQYGPTESGTAGSGKRGPELAPAQSKDAAEPGTSARGKHGWSIVPTFSAEETHTDNVRLAPPGSERSDWVTLLRPGIAVSGSGARLRLDASYTPQILRRAQEGSREVRQQLTANGNAELMQQLLFLDARATISQQNISLLGPQSESNINNTGNRTSVRTIRVSPYLRHAFGTNAQGEVRLTYSTVNSDASSSLSNSRANGINMQLTSGPAFKLYTWNLAYSTETIDYVQQAQQDVTTEKISANGRRLITTQVAVVSSVGYEKNNYATIGDAPSGVYWNTGLEWTPTPRTRLVATSGRRFYGATRSLAFTHRTRLTVWSANYSEEITSTRSQLLVPSTADTAGYLDTLFLSRIPDAAARESAVQDFIAQTGLPPSLNVPLNFFTNQTFLVKRWQASAASHGVRNTVVANAFRQTQSAQAAAAAVPAAGDFAASPSVEQTGASLIWNWRIAPLLASNLNVTYTRNEFSGIDREDNVKSIHLGLTRQFQPGLSGALNYRRLNSDSNQSGGGYTENAVSAALDIRF